MKFFRSIVRRGPFDQRHATPYSNECEVHSLYNNAQFHVWGPPQPKTLHENDFDTEIFAIYFLVTETIATYLWFSIAQHCLQGTRIPFLSPSIRYTIGILYGFMKMILLHYAFQSTIYFHVSLLVCIGYCIFASIALGWHRGPLWFLFYLKPPRLFQPFTITWFCQHVAYLFLQGISTSSVQSFDPKDSMSAQVQVLYKLQVPFDIELWNSTLIEHWRPTLVEYGNDPHHRRLLLDGSATEVRILFAMQSNGLLVSFYLSIPDATTVHSLMLPDISVYELVLRYHNHSSAERSLKMQFQSTPVVYYATNPISSPKSTPAQKKAISQLLLRLNINKAIGYKTHPSNLLPLRYTSTDLPLRLFRCPNFMSLPPRAPRRRSSAARSRFDDPFE